MKRIILFIGTLLSILTLLLAVLPSLFKEDLKKLAEKTVNEQIQGSFQMADFGVSFFTYFPRATLELEGVKLIGEGPFRKDTLFQADKVFLLANPFSLLGSSPAINKVVVESPKVHAIVLEDGTANWDIVGSADPDSESDTENDSEVVFNLNAYELKNATIRYEDATYPMDVLVTGVDHSGTGAFTSVEYDLNTFTQAEALTVNYAGINYLKKAVVDAKVLTHILAKEDMLITLKENEILINDLPINLNGEVLYKPDEMELDLSFASTEEAEISSLYSLIPGVYTESYNNLISEGGLSFNGLVKGVYSENKYPGFKVNLDVDDGKLKYPQLPKDISGIQLDLQVDNPDGNLEKTQIDIQKLEANLGDNPIYAKMLIKGLEEMLLEGIIKAKLDLGSLAQSLPLEGNELKGLFEVDASIDGLYSAAQERFPKVEAIMSMDNGYVKSFDYPEAELENLTFHATLKNPDGKMENSVFTVPDFAFILGGKPVEGNLSVDHFEDPHYKLGARGEIDLEKIMKIYPVEGMELSGNLVVDRFQTEGVLSDVEAERYGSLPTSGKMRISDLYYAQAELAHPLSIEKGTASFTPARLEMEGVKGKTGNTDFEASGYLENYLAYVLGESKLLKGVWAVQSNQVNINDWMLETEENPSSIPDSSDAYEEIVIPDGVELLVQAQVDKLVYKDLDISNMNGIVEVTEQSVLMDQVQFNLLNGQVGMRGSYQTIPLQDPAFAFDLKVDQMGFSEAAQHFDLVRRYAPVADYIQGLFNTNFSIQGFLNENMYPVLENINSAGLFEIIQGKIIDLPVLQAISTKTKLKDLNTLSLENVVGHFSIEDGSLVVEPFDFAYRDMNFSIGGQQKLTGAMNYSFAVDLPTGKPGEAVFTALSDMAGAPIDQERVAVTLNLGGTFKNPQISGLGTNAGEEIKGQVVDALKDKLEEKTGKAIDLGSDSTSVVEAAQDSLGKIAEQKKDALKDSLAAEMEAKQGEIHDKIDKTLEEKLGKDTKGKLEELKDKVDLPFLKKKKKK